MPEQQLKHIDETMVEILKEISILRKWVTKERQKRRITTAALAGAILASLVAIFSVWILVQDIDERARIEDYRDCLDTNEARQGIYRAFDILIDELAEGQENDPAVAERITRFNQNLRVQISQLECSLN